MKQFVEVEFHGSDPRFFLREGGGNGYEADHVTSEGYTIGFLHDPSQRLVGCVNDRLVPERVGVWRCDDGVVSREEVAHAWTTRWWKPSSLKLPCRVSVVGEPGFRVCGENVVTRKKGGGGGEKKSGGSGGGGGGGGGRSDSGRGRMSSHGGCVEEDEDEEEEEEEEDVDEDEEEEDEEDDKDVEVDEE